jgi:iron complex outermembrane receptor protein
LVAPAGLSGQTPGPEAVEHLREITVLAGSINPAAHAQPDTTAALLRNTRGLLLNSQGGAGSQNDLSLRGSSFSGAGLALGGISLRNPQTEHFHAELPLPAAILTRPTVLTGLAQAGETDGHLVGTVALDLLRLDEQKRIDVGAGATARSWQNLIYQMPAPQEALSGRLGWGVFATHEHAESLDYDDNDLESAGAGIRLQHVAGDLQGDLVVATRRKEFGARGYYGVNPDWYAEEEIRDELILASVRRGSDSSSRFRLAAMWRRLADDYTLFWDMPGVYANRHRSRVFAAFGDGHSCLGDGISVRWRGGVETEKLESSPLGTRDRRRGSALLMPEWESGRVRVSGGVRAEVFKGDSPAVMPQGGLRVRLRKNASVYCSYTETVRQPSFTELNYDSPGSLGNQGLERQRARSLEGGLRCRPARHSTVRLALFARRGDNTVDWVRELPSATRWVATDLGTVDTLGVELGVDYSPAEAIVVGLDHMWLNRNDDVDVYAGRYVLDYPEHLTRLSVAWQVRPSLDLVATHVLRWQTDNPVRTSADFGADGSLAVIVTPFAARDVRLTLAVDNVWNDHFETYPGQAVPKRKASAAVTMGW